MITTAIIPVAGMGTRFLPASKAQPKEMLAVVDKPVIQYIVEEAVQSGIRNIVFVTAIGKRAIEDHFDRNFELEYRLEQKKKMEELKTLSAIGKLANFAFVRQHKPMGDGDAVLAAVPFIDKHEAVAVLFGDDIIDGKKPALSQLMDVYETYHDSVVALQRVPKKEVSRYGIIKGVEVKRGVWEIERFVEKPTEKNAPSTLAAVGRYIITQDILSLLKKQSVGNDGEIRLADVFATHLQNKGVLYGRVFDGVRYDCGNKLGFLKAQIELGVKHPEIGKELKHYLKKRKSV